MRVKKMLSPLANAYRDNNTKLLSSFFSCPGLPGMLACMELPFVEACPHKLTLANKIQHLPENCTQLGGLLLLNGRRLIENSSGWTAGSPSCTYLINVTLL
jgi:hypothetical protein